MKDMLKSQVKDHKAEIDKLSSSAPKKASNLILNSVITFASCFVVFIIATYIFHYLTGNESQPNFLYIIVFSVCITFYLTFRKIYNRR